MQSYSPILHFGPSSVLQTQSGQLLEIRRVFQRWTDIPDPQCWNSVDQWANHILHAIQSGAYVCPLPSNWTPDQVMAYQWFESSNIRLENVSTDVLDQLLMSISVLQIELNMCIQSGACSIAYRDSLFHSIRLLENEYNDCVTYGNRYVLEQTSAVLVKSGTTLVPLYMNIQTGVLGITGATLESSKGVFGTTFAELGLHIDEVYRLEMGQYIRVA